MAETPVWHRSGGFLVADPTPEDEAAVVTPEQARAEVEPIAAVARDFVQREVLAQGSRLLEHDYPTLRALLGRAGELGLLGVEVEEAYGGSALGSVFGAAVTEEVARSGDFAVTFGAHTGIGTLPLALFGTPEQKARYLPDLVAGRKVAAYALTEPMAGSDALASRTRATPVEGGYVLEGQKQWITNAGFADLFVVYARVGGERFTAFLVEAGSPGLSLGPEEDKLGIRGSSTRAVFLDRVHVPAANVLGEVGRGHVVAFGVLNVGRFKLAAGSLGSGKAAMAVAAAYAEGRQQFGRAIAEFGLVQEKLARMAVRLYALESMVYRTAGLLDRRARADGHAAAVGEMAVECSANKVFGSEALSYIVDEALQIHGGYGFMNDYPVSRMYRDARINRIFEGTNEINRLVIPDSLMRRAMRAGLPLLQAMAEARQAVEAGGAAAGGEAGWLAAGGALLPDGGWMRRLRQAVLYAASLMVERHGTALESEQEQLGRLADMVIAFFAAQSAWIRARRAAADGAAEAGLHAALAALAIEEAARQVEQAGRDLVGEAGALERLTGLLRRPVLPVIGLQRQVAAAVRAAGGYPLGPR
ncbi:MAG TPA: acyl-CoA dehydrogenase family protein [Limnochordales bacterium]